MTGEQQHAWARVVHAASAACGQVLGDGDRGEVNRELLESTTAAVFTRLSLTQVAQAMCAGWPGLDIEDARLSVQAYLERQTTIDHVEISWTLTDLAGEGAS